MRRLKIQGDFEMEAISFDSSSNLVSKDSFDISHPEDSETDLDFKIWEGFAWDIGGWRDGFHFKITQFFMMAHVCDQMLDCY